METPDQHPNQFRQTSSPAASTEEPMGVKLPEPERELPPRSPWQNVVIIGLGLLLIVGGIFLGMRNRDNDGEIVELPDYSPEIVEESPSEESPAATPSNEEVTPSPESSPSSEVVTLPKTPVNVAVKAPTKVTVKPKQVTTAPQGSTSASTQSSLPAYQAVVGLPDYQPQHSSPLPSPKTITLRLVTPGHTYTIEAYQTVTVAALMQAARSQGFVYETKQFSFGTMVTSINGQSEGSGKYWTFKKNGVFSQLGIDAQTVADGDVITWELVSI